MPTKAFSIEDGNLNTRTINAARTRDYLDIDLNFAARGSGDIYKKRDAAAVKQAIKNLLLTNMTEKPFNPLYGGDLNRFLFSLSEDFDVDEIKEQIVSTIVNYEPRVAIKDVQVLIFPDIHDAKVTVIFEVINTTETVSLDITISRVR